MTLAMPPSTTVYASNDDFTCEGSNTPADKTESSNCMHDKTNESGTVILTSNDDSCLSMFYRQHASGNPMPNRNETVAVVKALMGQRDENGLTQQHQRPSLTNVYGRGPMLLSDIPESCCRSFGKHIVAETDKVIIGIDEAGRGSVMGPMVYGAAYWTISDYQSKIVKNGACWTDSKKLSDVKRFDIMDNIILKTAEIGFACRIIHANEISRNMTRTAPYNLNQMSHDAAIAIIHKIIQAGVTNIDTCYIDTVGTAETYQRKLEQEFHAYDIKFVVESKADDKYAPCSAASIVAKVFRDRILENWKFSENLQSNKNYGSGYPSDPTCKKWMQENIQSVFGFSDLVRFSWGPTKKILQEKAVPVVFVADLEKENEEEDSEMNLNMLKRQQSQMQAFLNGSNKRKRDLPFFKRRKLITVTKL